MEKKKLNKLTLKKEVISSLTSDELKNVKGGWTTTFGECSHILCCNTLAKSCNFTNCDDACNTGY